MRAAVPKRKSGKLLHAPAALQVILLGVVKQKARRDDSARKLRGGDAGPPGGLDREEVKIYLQSLPAEELTRDFLQGLLDEHLENRKPSPCGNLPSGEGK